MKANNHQTTAYKVNVKWSRYRPGVAQRVGRGIALIFHDRDTTRRWVVSGTPRPHFTPGKDTVPILQEAGWAPGPVWTGGKSPPHRDSIPDRPVRKSVAIPTELSGPQRSHPIRKQTFRTRKGPTENWPVGKDKLSIKFYKSFKEFANSHIIRRSSCVYIWQDR